VADGAAATVAFAPPTNNESSPPPTTEVDRGDATEAAEAQPQQAEAEPVEVDQSSLSPQAEGAEAASGDSEIEAPADAANAAGVDATEASAADVSEVDAPEQVDAAGAEAAAAEAIAAESMSVSQAEPMPEDALEPGAEIETAAAGTESAETPPAAETGAAATDQISAVLSESPPQAIATETVAEHDNQSVTPSPEATSAEKAEAPGIGQAEPSGNVRAQATDESTRGHPQAARAEVTAAAPVPPRPPLPKRKPEIQTARTAPQPDPAPRKEAPKQTEVRPAVAQAVPAQTPGGFSRWLPMALAPADKPVAKEPQRLTGPSYSSKVWSALARHKPRAGQNGSATVVFSIGMGGGLNSLSIGKSSGNARIDQLALATVRGAAPFPPPPSGPASFSIRINFH
jgi:protein TonB